MSIIKGCQPISIHTDAMTHHLLLLCALMNILPNLPKHKTHTYTHRHVPCSSDISRFWNPSFKLDLSFLIKGSSKLCISPYCFNVSKLSRYSPVFSSPFTISNVMEPIIHAAMTIFNNIKKLTGCRREKERNPTVGWWREKTSISDL